MKNTSPNTSPYAGLPLAEELQPIEDPAPGTAEAIMAEWRHTRATDTRAMAWLPQLPDEWAHAIHTRVVAAEQTYAAPSRQSEEYLNGTASCEDDVAEVIGRPHGMLFSAEHATKTPRLNKETGGFEMGFADVGTAGMAAVLGEDWGRAFIMRGRQTKPLADPDFAAKAHILAALSQHDGFVSVHGCSSRAFVRATDPTGIHAHIGLGIDPTDAERDYAEQVVRYGREELGLYVVTGNDQPYYVQAGPDGRLRRNKDGTPYRGQLAAQKPYMTTNFVRQALRETGRSSTRAIQVEAAPLLLPTAVDGPSSKDHKAEVMGVAFGYLLLSKAAELAIAASGGPSNNQA